ncbi:toxin [Enterococcus faecalis]|uniref:ImmA/IrrE family metallo-endopeptidase n=1 Tax=Enterococcus faecalis TaxID=1351 RepID=UPI0011DD8852|nr:ImmA/IrrE family metallo-endopeptidase [Enterococcus faecalis]TXW51164.1 toxin [Enterococcus faecalis]
MIPLKLATVELERIFKITNSYDPFVIASFLDVDIVYTSKLPDGYHGLAVPELNAIFIASFLNGSNYSYFVCSHELTHLALHKGINSFYNANRYSRSKMECEADTGAIYLLCKYYLHHVTNDEDLNFCTIASYFGLNEEFYTEIKKCLYFILE